TDFFGSYSSKYTSKELPYTRFVYHCAQLKTRQHVPRKSDAKKQRDKGMMDAFDCNGWLHMMIWDDAPSETSTPAAWISIKHDNDHIPYWRIEVPLPIQEYIQNNPEMRPKQLWDGILRDFGIQKFSRKSVYNLWAEREQKKWRRDADEKKSAELLIEEAVKMDWGPGVGRYSIQSVPLPQIDGIDALAFSMPEALRKWGGRIRELALDSAWNTNGSAYEIYAVLGEIYGSGCPLAYLLIKVTTSQAAGAKEQYVQAVLRHLRDAWKINAHVTLSDKDWTEINACCAKRLPIKDRAPAFYDVVAAHAEFDFIKIDFVPVAQVNTVRDPVRLLSAFVARHLLTLFQGDSPAHDHTSANFERHLRWPVTQSGAATVAAPVTSRTPPAITAGDVYLQRHQADDNCCVPP
ncbi:hypothetical protein EV121DRAFT_218537, partial [Schizophyllum commune]